MTAIMPTRLISTYGTLSVCLIITFSVAYITSESRIDANRTDSTAYAKQLVLDITPFPNEDNRYRPVMSLMDSDLDQDIEQPVRLSGFPASYAMHSFGVELLNPQSLAVSNPSTRSPPAGEAYPVIMH